MVARSLGKQDSLTWAENDKKLKHMDINGEAIWKETHCI
jgi:hypothetical protein